MVEQALGENRFKVGGKIHLVRNGVHLYIDPDEPNWISTNRIGSEVIESLDELAPGDIAAILSRVYGLSEDQVKTDVDSFLNELKKRNFQFEKSVAKKPYRGRAQVIDCGKLTELWIYTNRSFNLSCNHCFINAGLEKKEILNTAEFKKLIDEARKLGVVRFYLTGGEPFLRKDIFELINYILCTGKEELIILSNGTLLKGRILKNLKNLKTKLLTIQVSLEGPNPEVNDAIRGPGSFNDAVQGIKNLVQIGVNPVVTTTLSRHNFEHVTKIPKLLKSLGVKHLHVLLLQSRGRAIKCNDKLGLDPEIVTDVMRRLVKKSREQGVVLDNEMSILLRAQAKRGRKHDLCNSCYEMLSVDSDGTVYPCAPLTGEDYFNCGSVKESSLKNIWLDSEKTRIIRENSVVFREGCMECYLRFFCGGGCFCQSFYSSKAVGRGDITKKDPYCPTFKSIIHDVLWELASPMDVKKNIVDYEKPVIFSSMESRLPSCAVPSTRVTDFSSEVGLFHCSCVLSVDLEGKEKILGEGDHRLNRDACFNELAHEYEEWLRSPIGVTYNSFAKERVYSKMGLRKGERILEVGCGTGNYALDLAMDNDVFGCDVSEWMLRVCIKKSEARKLNLSVHHMASEDLPFPDESFDAVLCVNVLEFALDPEALLEEMNRVLKKSGRLVVGVLNKNSVWGLTQGLKKSFAKGGYYEARFYTPDEIKALLQKINPGVEIDTALFFPPVNNRKILGLSKIFEGIGRKYFKNNGALIIVKALKT